VARTEELIGKLMLEPEAFVLHAELDEAPSQPRPDTADLEIRCDENGNVVKDTPELERRGVTSHPELWKKSTVHKLSVVSKLLSLGRADITDPLARCHTEEKFALCTGCRHAVKFFNRCERHYCAECQARLSRDRRDSVEWWAREIKAPKHVVLTVRNTDTLTKLHVQTFKECFSRLRRTKFARNWRGGFYRLEVTNESKGWHLHLHALIDAEWIAQSRLAEAWAKIVGQDIAIVHVRDVHSRDYLAEVTKYTVKGSQLASWTAEQIAQFVDAFSGVRSFGVFGQLYGKRTEWREWIDSIQERGHVCKCGCSSFRILDRNELEWENIAYEERRRCVPTLGPPKVSSQTELNIELPSRYAAAFR